MLLIKSSPWKEGPRLAFPSRSRVHDKAHRLCPSVQFSICPPFLSTLAAQRTLTRPTQPYHICDHDGSSVSLWPYSCCVTSRSLLANPVSFTSCHAHVFVAGAPVRRSRTVFSIRASEFGVSPSQGIYARPAPQLADSPVALTHPPACPSPLAAVTLVFGAPVSSSDASHANTQRKTQVRPTAHSRAHERLKYPLLRSQNKTATAQNTREHICSSARELTKSRWAVSRVSFPSLPQPTPPYELFEVTLATSLSVS